MKEYVTQLSDDNNYQVWVKSYEAGTEEILKEEVAEWLGAKTWSLYRNLFSIRTPNGIVQMSVDTMIVKLEEWWAKLEYGEKWGKPGPRMVSRYLERLTECHLVVPVGYTRARGCRKRRVFGKRAGRDTILIPKTALYIIRNTEPTPFAGAKKSVKNNKVENKTAIKTENKKIENKIERDKGMTRNMTGSVTENVTEAVTVTPKNKNLVENKLEGSSSTNSSRVSPPVGIEGIEGTVGTEGLGGLTFYSTNKKSDAKASSNLSFFEENKIGKSGEEKAEEENKSSCELDEDSCDVLRGITLTEEEAKKIDLGPLSLTDQVFLRSEGVVGVLRNRVRESLRYQKQQRRLEEAAIQNAHLKTPSNLPPAPADVIGRYCGPARPTIDSGTPRARRVQLLLWAWRAAAERLTGKPVKKYLHGVSKVSEKKLLVGAAKLEKNKIAPHSFTIIYFSWVKDTLREHDPEYKQLLLEDIPPVEMVFSEKIIKKFSSLASTYSKQWNDNWDSEAFHILNSALYGCNLAIQRLMRTPGTTQEELEAEVSKRFPPKFYDDAIRVTLAHRERRYHEKVKLINQGKWAWK